MTKKYTQLYEERALQPSAAKAELYVKADGVTSEK